MSDRNLSAQKNMKEQITDIKSAIEKERNKQNPDNNANSMHW
jgi:hypothetical protein